MQKYANKLKNFTFLCFHILLISNLFHEEVTLIL